MKQRYYLVASLILGIAFTGCYQDTSSQTGVATTPAYLEGPEALVYAVQGGDLPVVKSLVEQYPSVLTDTDHNGNTLLHIAGAYNRQEVVAYLMEQGANPQVRNVDGLTAYEYADAENADQEVLDLMAP